ncbi:hypothetical protein LEN26_009236 [Aphanomyces euteiches]|nr:hypothetical protein AeMF1_004805 [Aphanomyces euteiches]KAH9127533.1 hypothetical protein LEN26_009236 [Aphanomyces euteiches]KAH9185947.1 hypothetical protein AeNC1_012077 [Aphanomyces euteiches]
MVFFLVFVGIVGASVISFPFTNEAIDWNAFHSEWSEGDDGSPQIHAEHSSLRDCMLCRGTVSYISGVKRLPNFSCPALYAGVDLTCSWLARNKSTSTCNKLTDEVPRIKDLLRQQRSITKICRTDLPFCGKKHEAEMETSRSLASAEVESDTKRGKHCSAKCARCWIAVKYVNASRRIRDLPEKAIEVGTDVICKRGRRHRHGCHELAQHVPEMVKGLKNGSSALSVCRRLHYCPCRPHDIDNLYHADEFRHSIMWPRGEDTKAVQSAAHASRAEADSTNVLAIACLVLALVAIVGMTSLCVRRANLDATGAYIAVPHEE